MSEQVIGTLKVDGKVWEVHDVRSVVAGDPPERTVWIRTSQGWRAFRKTTLLETEVDLSAYRDPTWEVEVPTEEEYP